MFTLRPEKTGLLDPILDIAQLLVTALHHPRLPDPLSDDVMFMGGSDDLYQLFTRIRNAQVRLISACRLACHPQPKTANQERRAAQAACQSWTCVQSTKVPVSQGKRTGHQRSDTARLFSALCMSHGPVTLEANSAACLLLHCLSNTPRCTTTYSTTPVARARPLLTSSPKPPRRSQVKLTASWHGHARLQLRCPNRSASGYQPWLAPAQAAVQV